MEIKCKGVFGIIIFCMLILIIFLIGLDYGQDRIMKNICKENESINWNNVLNAYQSIGGYIFLKGDDSEYYNQTTKNYQEIYNILSDDYDKFNRWCM